MEKRLGAKERVKGARTSGVEGLWGEAKLQNSEAATNQDESPVKGRITTEIAGPYMLPLL